MSSSSDADAGKSPAKPAGMAAAADALAALIIKREYGKDDLDQARREFYRRTTHQQVSDIDDLHDAALDEMRDAIRHALIIGTPVMPASLKTIIGRGARAGR